MLNTEREHSIDVNNPVIKVRLLVWRFFTQLPEDRIIDSFEKNRRLFGKDGVVQSISVKYRKPGEPFMQHSYLDEDETPQQGVIEHRNMVLPEGNCKQCGGTMNVSIIETAVRNSVNCPNCGSVINLVEQKSIQH